MTVTTYSQWVADGSPWKPSQPVVDFSATLRAHGYTVYVIGNHGHATANPPEDHMPYSHTAWPGTQPYDYVLAMDVMPGGTLDWHELGRRLVADKNANVPGTEAIKYINWTNASGQCLHEKWQPNHVTSKSSDTGHIHISFRTDYVTSNAMKDYNPLAFNPTSGSGAKPPSFAQLAVDGKMGPATIKRMQQYFGTPQDGVISRPSMMVKALQKHINDITRRGIAVDGLGLVQDGHTRSNTIGGLQCIVGATQDGYLSIPVSEGIKAVQQRLNANKL